MDFSAYKNKPYLCTQMLRHYGNEMGNSKPLLSEQTISGKPYVGQGRVLIIEPTLDVSPL